MNGHWDFGIDDETPTRLEAVITSAMSLPALASLCDGCARLDFAYRTRDLRQRASICGLCGMLWDVCQKHGRDRHDEVKFEKYQSTLRMDDGNAPVLSLIRSLGMLLLLLLCPHDADRAPRSHSPQG